LSPVDVGIEIDTQFLPSPDERARQRHVLFNPSGAEPGR